MNTHTGRAKPVISELLESESEPIEFGLESDGRSDRVRTCGIDVPNVARYQLRHTPMCEKY